MEAGAAPRYRIGNANGLRDQGGLAFLRDGGIFDRDGREREKQCLLEIARASVATAAKGEEVDPVAPEAVDGTLLEPRAAFVTLHDEHGELRGCVGTTAAIRPLFETVHVMARAAALRDPRFTPVTEAEVDQLDIEISVLEPLEAISSLDEVEIGRHGLVVEGRGCRGLLLPQVASERGWSVPMFAAATCEKAGLDVLAYESEDVSMFRFGTEVFGEEEN